MARLQILELPTEHHGDDMVTPFVLVIDQVSDGLRAEIARWPDNSATRIGARQILCIGDTVEIPANETPLLTEAVDAEHAGTTQIVYAHERTRLDLCSALLASGDTTWPKLIETVHERQRELAGLYRKMDAAGSDPAEARSCADVPGCDGKCCKPRDTDKEMRRTAEAASAKLRHLGEILEEARQWARHGYEIGQRHCSWTDYGVAPDWLTEGWPHSFDSCEHLKQAAAFDEALARVRNLSTEPEVMNADQPHPDVWRHGYRCGVLAARSATRPRNEPTVKP